MGPNAAGANHQNHHHHQGQDDDDDSDDDSDEEEEVLEELGRDEVIGELNPGTWDFAFLNERAFMLTVLGGKGSISIHSFGGGRAEAEAQAKAKGQPLGSYKRKPPVHVATLWLPALEAGQEIHHFSTHTAPFLGGDLTGLSAQKIRRDHANETRHGFNGVGDEDDTDDAAGMIKPFVASQENRIHLLSFHYGIIGPRFHLFAKNDFFMGYVRRYEASLLSNESVDGMQLDGMGFGMARKAKDVEWADWGPKNTRFLEHNISFQWLRCVFHFIHPFSLISPFLTPHLS